MEDVNENVANDAVEVSAAESSTEVKGSAREKTGFRRNYNYGNGGMRKSQNFSGNNGGYKRNNFKRKRKVCEFCAERLDFIDYKDVNRLSRFVSDRFKINSRRSAGTCAKHQRELAVALKRARYMALLPYCNV